MLLNGLLLLSAISWAIDVQPMEQGPECPKDQLVNLAQFHLTSGALENRLSEREFEDIVSVKLHAYYSHSYVDTVVFIYQNGESHPWIVDMPVHCHTRDGRRRQQP